MNKMSKITGMLMGLGLMGLTASASAKPGWDGPQTKPYKGTPARMAATQAKRFAQMDQNQDGQLQVEELLAYRIQKLQDKIRGMDANGDGIISRQERKQAKQTHRQAKAERRAERQKMKVARQKSKALRKAERQTKKEARQKMKAARKAERQAKKEARRQAKAMKMQGKGQAMMPGSSKKWAG